MDKIRTTVLVLTALFSVCPQADARQDFLSAWKRIYPESASGKRECQLCHQRTEGGDGWNSYGITIRFALLDIFGGFDIDAAIVEVEQENADFDEQGLTNRQEIELGLDPGWVAGNNNDISFKNFQVLLNQPPPFSDVDGAVIGDEGLCFPVAVSSGALALICL